MKTIMKIIYPAFTLFAFASFALSPTVKAVTPPPDGDYPGGNTAEGFNALFSLSTQDGGFNTAVGFYSLAANVNGSFNTGVGAGALDLNTGHNNTAVGAAALLLNTTATGNTAVGTAALALSNADGNTAVGAAALSSNVTGPGNTAVGAQTLFSNTGDNENPPNGRLNTAVGLLALYSNTTGNGNTAVGAGPGGSNPIGPLGSNTTGDNNTAVGGTDGTVNAALGSNTTGSSNTAVGADALGLNTTGIWNTAVGKGALSSNTTGLSNTAVGRGALSENHFGGNNTAVGAGALANLAPSPTPSASPTASPPGENNVALGFNAGSGVVTASNVICIGANIAGADVSDTAWIGNVYGMTTQNGTAAPVIVSADGQLGTVVSSERFKKDISTMDKASEAVMSLRPVTFHYKSDAKNTPQFGLIAEEVANVNPALVLPDKEGKPYTVRYDAVNAMLLNEFLKEHRKVEQQRKDFEAALAQQQKEIEALTAGLQKVSAQLELSKATPQTVLNSQ